MQDWPFFDVEDGDYESDGGIIESCTPLPSDDEDDDHVSDGVIMEFCTQLPSDDEDDDHESDGESENEFDLEDGSPKELAMVAQPNKFWEPGETIPIRFLGGDPSLRKKVEKYAKIWEKYANITFKFVNQEPSVIRISFDLKAGSFSRVGTDARNVTSPHATMNLAVTTLSRDDLVRCFVLHEFGHALGCVHEHSSPRANISWNTEAVYKFYAKLGWSRQQVDDNVLLKYDESTTRSSAFDPHSIMIYPIPRNLTEGGSSVSLNTDLSDLDKQFIADMYPGNHRAQFTGNGESLGRNTGQVHEIQRELEQLWEEEIPEFSHPLEPFGATDFGFHGAGYYYGSSEATELGGFHEAGDYGCQGQVLGGFHGCYGTTYDGWYGGDFFPYKSFHGRYFFRGGNLFFGTDDSYGYRHGFRFYAL